jgi:uncharacterized membrane protein
MSNFFDYLNPSKSRLFLTIVGFCLFLCGILLTTDFATNNNPNKTTGHTLMIVGVVLFFWSNGIGFLILAPFTQLLGIKAKPFDDGNLNYDRSIDYLGTGLGR